MSLAKMQLKTERRRIFQPVWNAFCQVILPRIHEGIALCVSGGADSRALMEAVARWPLRHQGRLMVFSVDHGTREQSNQEAKAVVARARVLGFEAHLICLEPSAKADEATLRKYRYQALWRLASMHKIGSLCTAHHQDDDAEGFLMDLFGLGGGHEGSAMQVETKTIEGILLRPLLSFSHKSLLQLLTVIQATDYFTDPSNTRSAAKRSQVRQLLNTDLSRFHPHPHRRLAHVARRRSLDLEALYAAADQLIEIRDADLLYIPLLPNISDAILLRALTKALKILSSEQDLRQANATLSNLLIYVKKVIADDSQGLDQIASSITLSGKKLARFDLPGVLATVTLTGIELQRIRSNHPFSVHNVVF